MKRQKYTSVVGGKCNTPTTMPSQNRETHAIITRAKRNGFMLHRPKRIDIKELNPHLICVLCGGYYIDATTIIECLHSFCRTCIVRYLESSNVCPICDVIVHKSKPLQNIRPDNTLQDLVYKLVPRLFKDEMKRRRDLYASVSAEEVENHAVPADTEGRGEEVPERVIYSDDENISLSLELSPNGRPPDIGFDPHSSTIEAKDRRFLSCPAAFTVTLIKRFIRTKFTLSDEYQIDIYHTDEPLNDFYTLMDIAYIYVWKRKGPLRLFYTVYCDPVKKRKISNNDEEEPMEIVQEIKSFSKVDGKSEAKEKMKKREFEKLSLPRSELTVTSSEGSFAPAPSVPPAAPNPSPVPSPPHIPSPAPEQAAPTPSSLPVSITAPAPVSTSSPVSASFPVSASSPVSTTAPVSSTAHVRPPPQLSSPLHLTTTTSSTTTVTTSVATSPPTPSPTPIPTLTPISTPTPINSTTTLTSTPTSTYTQTSIPAPPPTPAPTPKPREHTPPPPPPPTPSVVTESPTAPEKMTRPQNINIPSTIQVTEPAQKRTAAVTTAPAASLPKITAKSLPHVTTTPLTMVAPTPPTPAPTPVPRITTAPSPVRISPVSALRPPPPLPHTLATKSDQKGTFLKQRQLSPPQQPSLQKHHQQHQHQLHKQQHMPHLQLHKQHHHPSHQQQQLNRQEHQATKPASHFEKNHHHHHHHHHHHQGPDLTKQIPDCRNGEAPDFYPEQTEPLSLKIEMKDRDCCGKHQNNGKPPRIQEKMIPVRSLNGQFSCRGCKTEMHGDSLNSMTSPISNHSAHKFLVTGPIYTPLNLTNGRMDDITPLNLKKEPEKANNKNRSK